MSTYISEIKGFINKIAQDSKTNLEFTERANDELLKLEKRAGISKKESLKTLERIERYQIYTTCLDWIHIRYSIKEANCALNSKGV